MVILGKSLVVLLLIFVLDNYLQIKAKDMKKYILLIAIVFTVFKAQAQSNCGEVKAIKQVIESAYLDGVQNIGDMDKINAGFHPDFRMQVLAEDGRLSNVSFEKFKEMVRHNIADGILPRKMGQFVKLKYLNIDVCNNAASVKIDYILNGKSVYIDYMQLYKFPEGWKIVNKIYYTVGD